MNLFVNEANSRLAGPAQQVNQSSILNQFTALSELMELIDLLMSGAATQLQLSLSNSSTNQKSLIFD